MRGCRFPSRESSACLWTVLCALRGAHYVHCVVLTMCTAWCSLCALRGAHYVHCVLLTMCTAWCSLCALRAAHCVHCSLIPSNIIVKISPRCGRNKYFDQNLLRNSDHACNKNVRLHVAVIDENVRLHVAVIDENVRLHAAVIDMQWRGLPLCEDR